MLVRLWSMFRCQRGASAVEFAIIVSPLLMLVFGVCEYARMLWSQSALQQTAIVGARCIGLLQTSCASGGVLSTTNAISFIQTTAAGWMITLPSSGITITQSTSCGGVSGFSSVQLSYTFVSAVPYLFSFSTSGVNLVSSACFPTAS